MDSLEKRWVRYLKTRSRSPKTTSSQGSPRGQAQQAHNNSDEDDADPCNVKLSVNPVSEVRGVERTEPTAY